MALQYGSPVTKDAFVAALAANTHISATTTDAINSILDLGTAESLVVAGWNGVGAVTAPVGQSPDALLISAADDANLTLPSGTEDTKLIIVDSQAGSDVALTVGAAASASARLLATDAVVEGIARVVVGGDGNDTITVNGSANVLLDGGAGNDNLVTGSGNDVIIAGTGTNTIDAGAGNDTIVTGLGVDTIAAGAGFDTIDVVAASTNFTASVVDGALVLAGTGTSAGNSVTATDAEFVTFSDGKTLAVVSTQEEAQALSLYSALLGRDVDATGAASFSAQVQAGTSLQDIAQSFLTSAEHFSNLRADFLTDVYSSLLGREADATGVATWQAQFEAGATRGEIIGAIAGSAEAASLTDTDFVSALYTSALGRDAEEAGLNNWVALLASGASRTDVADLIYSSAESNHNINADFVESLFDNALGNDANELAKDFAVKALDGGSVTQADVVIAVIGQAEAQDHITNVIVVPGVVA